MWIRRDIWDETKQEIRDQRHFAAIEQEKCKILSEQNKVLQVNLDHARLRLNQLEKQNAQYIYQIAGVKIPTPEFTPSINLHDAAQTMAELADVFEDMGNERASKLGISHNPDGTIKYPD